MNLSPPKPSEILIVDDRTENFDVVRSLLEPFGYEVTTASNADEAYRLLSRRRPDLILSDLHMPPEPPFAFIERVKGDEKLTSIPFIFISSTTKKESIRQRGLQLGAAKFLFRPIEPEKLLAELEECLSLTSQCT